MTDKEIINALEYWEEFDKEINELLKKYPSEEKMLLEQKEIVNITIQTFKTFNRQKAEIERYKGVIRILEKDVKNERAEAMQELYNRLKVAEFEPIPIEIKDYAEGYNKAMRDVRMYVIYEYGVKPLSRKQAEQALIKGDEGNER